MRSGIRTFIVPAAMLLTALATAFSCGGHASRVLEDANIRAELTEIGGLAVWRKTAVGEVQLATGGRPAFAVTDSEGREVQLSVSGVEPYQPGAENEFGPGRGLLVNLAVPAGDELEGLTVRVRLCLHDTIPGVLVCRADIEGLTGGIAERFGGTSFYRMDLRADLADPTAEPYDFLLYQGAGYRWGKWYTRIEVDSAYSAPNWTVRHLPDQQEGGGYPFNYLWTRNAGLALAHIDTVHRVAALPVRSASDGPVALSLDRPAEFIRPDADGAAAGLPVIIGAFEGDYFEPLRAYGRLLERGSFRFADPPEDSYETIWCGWGFGRDFTPDDIYRTLPHVKALDIPWVVIDDGFQRTIGSWPLIEEKFPRGDADMRALVDSIHAAGFKAKLWWVPMNVQSTDPLMEEHADWVVLDEEGREKREEWWDVSQLCPAHPPVVEQQRELVRKFLRDWDFDGFKMDGGCLGMVTPCYNPAHGHEYPEESCQAVADFFAMIREEAERIKPGAVLEVCECGLPHDPYKMQHYNQQVSADPVSSDQVRARLKAYRALLGEEAAIYGDHVELSTGPYRGEGAEVAETGRDFASTLALGGVIGSKFTDLVEDPTAEQREKFIADRDYWRRWFALYDDLKLYRGSYLNLYDVGWDLPETHVVAVGDTLYYGIFAQGFSGTVSLRGLDSGRNYALENYATGVRLGSVSAGETAELECSVDDHLLVRAVPRD